MSATSPALEVPRDVSEVFERFFATEYAYFTPKGEPLCWPVSPYWYPERGVLAVATGIAYPNKADYPKQNPKVGLLFSDPVTSGLEGTPTILVQGNATVLDADIQANTDRYVREMRSKFPQARLGLNPLTVRFLDFYLPRLWVEITPVRVSVWRGSSDEPVVIGAPLPAGHRETSPAPGLETPGNGPSPEAKRMAVTIAEWAAKYGEAVVTVRGPEGYPVMLRTSVSVSGSTIKLAESPGTGPAALTFHSVGLGGIRFDAQMARGHLEATHGESIFRPRRIVGLFGADRKTPSAKFFPTIYEVVSSMFPFSAFSRIAQLRRRLRVELERRGQPMPKLRIPR